MPDPRPEVLDFLLTRRSRPAKTLGEAGPDRAALEVLLTAAARSPDHGKLVPWRFVVMQGAARAEVAAKAATRAGEMGLDVMKTSIAFTQGQTVVAVLASPKPSEKIPVWEQELSAGAVCLALLNAALAAGWGANWLSGPLVRDPVFLAEALKAAEGEWVAGFIHIGSETVAPADRPRPDLAEITTWL